MGMAADNLECYENLANAIILQAVKDYKTVLFRLEDHPNNRDAQYEKKRLDFAAGSSVRGLSYELRQGHRAG